MSICMFNRYNSFVRFWYLWKYFSNMLFDIPLSLMFWCQILLFQAPDEEFEEHLRHLIGEKCSGDKNEVRAFLWSNTVDEWHSPVLIEWVCCFSLTLDLTILRPLALTPWMISPDEGERHTCYVFFLSIWLF